MNFQKLKKIKRKKLVLNFYALLSLLIMLIFMFYININPLYLIVLLPLLSSVFLYLHTKFFIKDTEENQKTKSKRAYSEEDRTFDSFESYLKNKNKIEEVKKDLELENHLKVLNIKRNELNRKTLKRKYKELAKKYHPDKIQSLALKKEFSNAMSTINESYSFLLKKI